MRAPMNEAPLETPARGTTAVRIAPLLRRGVSRVLPLALFGYVLWCAALWVLQERMLFPGAWRERMRTSGPIEPGVRQIWLDTAPGVRVEAWYHPGPDPESTRGPRPAVMLFHGNGELVDHAWGNTVEWRRAGFAVLAMEYRGFGRAGGAPSEQGIVADAEAFYDWLASQHEIDPQRIVLHGVSLGGGVAIALAATRKPAAVVVESTFASVALASRRYLVPEFLLRHPFRSDERIRRVACPILIFHGRNDEVVSIHHARRLHAAAPNSRLIENDAGHMGALRMHEVHALLREAGVITP